MYRQGRWSPLCAVASDHGYNHSGSMLREPSVILARDPVIPLGDDILRISPWGNNTFFHYEDFPSKNEKKNLMSESRRKVK